MTCIKCRAEIDSGSLYCRYCGKKQMSTAAPKPLKRANGMGSIKKLTGRRRKPWLAVASHKVVGAGIKSVSLGTYAEKGEAAAALEKYYMSDRPKLIAYTVAQTYEAWKAIHFKTLGTSAQDSYTYAWSNYFIPISDMKMAEVKAATLQALIDTATAAGRSRAVCEKIQHLASHLCKYAMANDIIDKNYASLISLPKAVKPDKKRLSEDEFERIRAAALSGDADEAAAVAFVMIRAGMRISELFAIKKENVHLGERYMIGGLKTEAGENRTIPIHAEIAPIISRWMNLTGKKPSLLVNGARGISHDSHNYRERDFGPLKSRLGIRDEITPHCCRHTFASIAADENIPQDAVAAIMGHEKYETTADYYVHVDLKTLISAVDAMK